MVSQSIFGWLIGRESAGRGCLITHDHHAIHIISEVTFQVVRDVDTVRTDRTERKQSGASETNYRTPFRLDMRWPIPDPEKEPGGLKMIKYIGVNELEHAPSEHSFVGSSVQVRTKY